MQRMPWLMLWKEARTDLKLRQLNDAEHRCWFSLLCYAGDQNTPGIVSEVDEDTLALEVAADNLDVLRATLAKLKKHKIVDVTPGG